MLFKVKWKISWPGNINGTGFHNRIIILDFFLETSLLLKNNFFDCCLYTLMVWLDTLERGVVKRKIPTEYTDNYSLSHLIFHAESLITLTNEGHRQWVTLKQEKDCLEHCIEEQL